MPATHTPNLNLNKPDRQDLVSVVTDINDNMDTIDGAIGALPSGHTIQGQINTLKPVSIVLNPVTNANGATTVVTQDSRINEGLKAVYIEVGTPETFLAPIRITTGNGQIELYCANAVGSSTVTVVVEMATVTDSADPQPASVTSTEFDILANRIGTLSQLTTTQKTNLVGAVNEVNGNISALETRIDSEYLNTRNAINNANLNDYVTTGKYWFGTGATNSPFSSWFGVNVEHYFSGLTIQTATAAGGGQYVRTHNGSSWTSWQKTTP